ncbi:hypothetical protein PT974_05559 [Cladobotryum mycophilum]|uniref:FHA domain-containing protein n=1 Tax=Cladobotryum mycophilum TaxID=491253 RepID=A0ABR0SJ18_9HYPO
MATHHDDIIAWLIPTSRHSWADKSTHLPENTLLTTTIPPSKSPFPSSPLSHHHHLTTEKPPKRALRLSFNTPTKQPGAFVIGTDARTCDIVLPNLRGISSQHCSLGFDAEARLTLTDFSESGTSVWYDWESNGDQTDYSWILSAGCSSTAFPAMAQRITIDIQGIRFQLVVNDHSSDWDAYRAKVDDLSELPYEDTTAPWEDSTWPVDQPLFQSIVVKNLDNQPAGEVYLWNLARPWEPMVKASA